jgi:hypothetical protein
MLSVMPRCRLMHRRFLVIRKVAPMRIEHIVRPVMELGAAEGAGAVRLSMAHTSP